MSNPNNWLSYQSFTADSPTNLFRKLDAECTEPSELVHMIRDSFGQYTAVTRPKELAKRARKKTDGEQQADSAPAGTGGDAGTPAPSTDGETVESTDQ